ncbi:MAG: PEP/pyruvate-binding domain-containing protein [Actinobacteria bacterium]|nr:PEP/pyruvate-binding domain-containing protein [Actinomycetota bacterium]
MPRVLWIDDPAATSDLVGGKVASLAEMTAAGFAVPPAFGVTTEAFAEFLEAAGPAERIDAIRAGLDVADVAAVERAAAEIAALIEAAALPAEVEAEIRAAYAELERRVGADVPVAVRSSGVNEDLEGASFAGQYDTYLWVSGADDVVDNVRRCWSGLFNAAVLTYRPDGVESPAEAEIPGMGVGVQVMARARSAGVMFTLDPISGDRSRIVIESCWGLGEGVVKGDVQPDRHRVDKITLEVLEREVVDQAEEYRFDGEAGEVGLLPVPAERREEGSITEDEARTIAELGKRVERHRGGPTDCEWAIDVEGRLHLLQARPETIWSARQAAPSAGGNGNGNESGGDALGRVMATFLGARGDK